MLKKLIIIFCVVLTNIVAGQTLKFVKEKNKFLVSKDNSVILTLKDSSILNGNIIKLTDKEITVKTLDQEKKLY